jgi:hypothetical protein
MPVLSATDGASCVSSLPLSDAKELPKAVCALYDKLIDAQAKIGMESRK